jgi:hypothetical protein
LHITKNRETLRPFGGIAEEAAKSGSNGHGRIRLPDAGCGARPCLKKEKRIYTKIVVNIPVSA